VALWTSARWQVEVRLSSSCLKYSQTRGKRLEHRLDAVTGAAEPWRHAVPAFAFGVFSAELPGKAQIVRKLSSVPHPADESDHSAKHFDIDVIS
jgi:hypothetical protein